MLVDSVTLELICCKCIIGQVSTINSNANKSIAQLAVSSALAGRSRKSREVLNCVLPDLHARIRLRLDWVERLDKKLGVAALSELTFVLHDLSQSRNGGRTSSLIILEARGGH